MVMKYKYITTMRRGGFFYIAGRFGHKEEAERQFDRLVSATRIEPGKVSSVIKLWKVVKGEKVRRAR